MLNENKAIKYINKPDMVKAINEICSAIKTMNKAFTPKEYTIENSKKELFDAYGRFYIIYNDLKNFEIEEAHRAAERAEREERRRQAEIAKNTKELIKPAQPVKSQEELLKASKASKKIKADKAQKVENKSHIEAKKSVNHRIGDANERLIKYTAELAEKEARVGAVSEFANLPKDEQKAIHHRIASLKRKIERANKALEAK